MLIIKFLSLLDKKQKIILFFITLLSFVAMLLETFSIALLLPLIDTIVNGNLNYNNIFFNYFIIETSKYFNISILFIISILILLLFIAKSIFLVFFYFQQSKFASNILIMQSKKFYNLYINQSWSFHTNNNSSVFIRNLMNEIGSLMVFTETLIIMIVEIFVFFGLIILLFYLNFIASLVAFSFLFLISGSYYFITKDYINKLGERRVKNDFFRLKSLNETFRGMKEIKIFGKEEFFLNSYDKYNSIVAKTRQINKIFSYLPRILIELSLVIFIVNIILIATTYYDFDLKKSIPLITIFFASLLRIYPSIVRILNSLQVIKYNYKSVNILYKDFVNLKKYKPDINLHKKKSFYSINFKSVSFRYSEKSEYVFKDINLKIEKNSCLALIGESGGGKTTFIDLLLGLLEPSSGSIIIDEKKEKNLESSWKLNFGYVPQDVILLDSDIKNNIAFGYKNNTIDEDRIMEVLRMVDLDKFVLSLENGINTLIGENGSKISGGQKQRLGIARALYNNPEILIFDESTSALDNETENNILNTIKQLKVSKTIILISHNMNVVSICDKIYKINNKNINLI